MPNYFPENDTALPTDSSERSMAKVVSQLPAALDVIGLEPETAVYVARSGATDVAAIDAFVKGVKELGLWNNMVCWPLRSSQNKGSGNIVYSLGGLGTFNGTRVNNPAWTADGLTADNDTKHVRHNAGRDFGTSDFTFGACFKQQSFGTGGFVLGLYPQNATLPAYDMGVGGGGLLDAVIRNNTTVGGNSRVTAGQMVADTFAFAAATRSDNTLVSYLNGSSAGTSSTLASGVSFGRTDIQSVILGREAGSAIARNLVTQAFAFLVKGQAVNPSALYAVYKSTLGTGLGLP